MHGDDDGGAEDEKRGGVEVCARGEGKKGEENRAKDEEDEAGPLAADEV